MFAVIYTSNWKTMFWADREGIKSEMRRYSHGTWATVNCKGRKHHRHFPLSAQVIWDKQGEWDFHPIFSMTPTFAIATLDTIRLISKKEGLLWPIAPPRVRGTEGHSERALWGLHGSARTQPSGTPAPWREQGWARPSLQGSVAVHPHSLPWRQADRLRTALSSSLCKVLLSSQFLSFVQMARRQQESKINIWNRQRSRRHRSRSSLNPWPDPASIRALTGVSRADRLPLLFPALGREDGDLQDRAGAFLGPWVYHSNSCQLGGPAFNW